MQLYKRVKGRNILKVSPQGGPKCLVEPSLWFGSMIKQSHPSNLPLYKGKLGLKIVFFLLILLCEIMNPWGCYILKWMPQILSPNNITYSTHRNWNVQIDHSLTPSEVSEFSLYRHLRWEHGVMTCYQNNLTWSFVNIFSTKMFENSWSTCLNNRQDIGNQDCPRSQNSS